MANTYPRVVLTLSDSSTITWQDTDIIEAKLVEEMDPISATLPISVLTLKIFDANDDFSVFDENESLAERQLIDLSEILNGTEYYLGRFYLDEWKNTDQQTLDLRAVDVVGVMDTTPFNGKLYTSLTDLTDILDDIFADIPESFTLSSELENIQLKGLIEEGTVRTALQQVCFAAGTAVLTSRRNVFEIIKVKVPSSENWQDFDIGVNDKFMVQPTEILPIVTGIEVTTHDYYQEDTSYDEFISECYEDDELGLYTFNFDEIVVFSSVGGNRNAALVASGPHFITIEVFMFGCVSVAVYVWDEARQIFTFTESDLPLITKENKLLITGATMVNLANVQDVLNRLRDYYRLRYVHTFKPIVQQGSTYNNAVYNEDTYGWSTINIQIGQLVKLATLQGAFMRSLIRKATIDLTGGFLAEFEAIGVKINE